MNILQAIETREGIKIRESEREQLKVLTEFRSSKRHKHLDMHKPTLATTIKRTCECEGSLRLRQWLADWHPIPPFSNPSRSFARYGSTEKHREIYAVKSETVDEEEGVGGRRRASTELRSGLELRNQTRRGGGGATATRSDLVRSRFRRGRSGLEDGGGGWRWRNSASAAMREGDGDVHADRP
ncbi:hypothetical protein U1Q18_015692 [Sarracenia purpurea var. burkii]